MTADKATCRFRALFCTTYKYELIHIADQPFNTAMGEIFF